MGWRRTKTMEMICSLHLPCQIACALYDPRPHSIFNARTVGACCVDVLCVVSSRALGNHRLLTPVRKERSRVRRFSSYFTGGPENSWSCRIAGDRLSCCLQLSTSQSQRMSELRTCGAGWKFIKNGILLWLFQKGIKDAIKFAI